MLPKPKGETSDQTSTSMGRQQIPYLKSEDLTKEPQLAKILGVRATPNSRYNDVLIKVELPGGKTRFLGLRTKDPRFSIMYNAFGSDEESWTGQSFEIALRYDDFSEREVQNITIPQKARKAR